MTPSPTSSEHTTITPDSLMCTIAAHLHVVCYTKQATIRSWSISDSSNRMKSCVMADHWHKPCDTCEHVTPPRRLVTSSRKCPEDGARVIGAEVRAETDRKWEQKQTTVARMGNVANVIIALWLDWGWVKWDSGQLVTHTDDGAMNAVDWWTLHSPGFYGNEKH